MMRRFFATALLGLASASQLWAGYDPLLAGNVAAEPMDLVVEDEERSREIPIRVYLPLDETPAAVLLFSHGLGGNRAGSAYLGRHWASRGYVAVFLQHPGSDDGVWKDEPFGKRMAAMKQAAGVKNFQLRVQDVPAVLDQLEIWNDDSAHPLAERMDLDRVGMSGHSFGAVTTQATSGQAYTLGRSFTDPRIKAAVVMSPSAPLRGDAKTAFSNVQVPWMLLTGTLDGSPLTGADAKSRLAVFPALPPGEKYQLVLNEAEHSAFTDRALPGDAAPRNPNHHRAILAVTTAFWDAYLRDDAAAKQWLDGREVRSVLEADDQWQTK